MSCVFHGWDRQFLALSPTWTLVLHDWVCFSFHHCDIHAETRPEFDVCHYLGLFSPLATGLSAVHSSNTGSLLHQSCSRHILLLRWFANTGFLLNSESYILGKMVAPSSTDPHKKYLQWNFVCFTFHFWPAKTEDANVCPIRPSVWPNTFVQKITCHLLARMQMNLVWIFMVPGGWLLVSLSLMW